MVFGVVCIVTGVLQLLGLIGVAAVGILSPLSIHCHTYGWRLPISIYRNVPSSSAARFKDTDENMDKDRRLLV